VPTTIVNKGFSFSQGQVTLEVTLDKDMYYHGERVAARINVTNTSRKSVKNIRVRIRETGWNSYTEFTCMFSWRYNPLWFYFDSLVAGFSLLIFEVS